ncbi:hypothetical protein IPJ72_04795 [Candidatus Peregrinibacteria bacterium]|nr:MAG: hypothetical protein IPJ72_04795 [Candidatus Peregrinibacteria bacterium]
MGSWLLVIDNLSPFISGYLALSLFYASLMVSLSATFSLMNYYVRMAINRRNENQFYFLGVAVRQAILMSAVVCVTLIFQRLRVLTWWDALLLLIIAVLIEYYFLKKE